MVQAEMIPDRTNSGCCLFAQR